MLPGREEEPLLGRAVVPEVGLSLTVGLPLMVGLELLALDVGLETLALEVVGLPLGRLPLPLFCGRLMEPAELP